MNSVELNWIESPNWWNSYKWIWITSCSCQVKWIGLNWIELMFNCLEFIAVRLASVWRCQQWTTRLWGNLEIFIDLVQIYCPLFSALLKNDVHGIQMTFPNYYSTWNLFNQIGGKNDFHIYYYYNLIREKFDLIKKKGSAIYLDWVNAGGG